MTDPELAQLEEMIKASQIEIIKCAKEILADVRNNTKVTGLTWEQLDYFLDLIANTGPTIIPSMASIKEGGE